MNDSILQNLDKVIQERKNADPNDSYVAKLFESGTNKIAEKIGEEATETIIAAKDVRIDNPESKIELVKETADLWFHSMVMLAYQGLSSQDVLKELNKRFGHSGIVEKASRPNQ